MPSILLLGVSGLVGSHLILALRDHCPGLPVTVFLRNKNLDVYLYETAKVDKVVHGTFDEKDKIVALAKTHDIVINVGSSWDVPLSEAIVEGLKQQPDGKKRTLIHMSGTGNFVDKRWTDGAFHADTKVWSDDDTEDMKLINPEMLNGGPDTVVLNASRDSQIGTFIVFPSGIYGEAAGPVPALGVIQLVFREKAQELGFVPYVGDGSAIFNCLHVKAITPFMLLLLGLALQEDKSQRSVYERCFIIGGQEMPWKAASEAFAKSLHAEGVIPSPEARSVKLEEAGGGELPMLMASNMRLTSPRAQRLGYKNEEVSLEEYLKQYDQYLN
ncbi:hypothetical protein LTR10_018824 [Elasticomyces elasticus]|uniref:NAD(P)-binding domain-containing protein n=1 Tax=Exophiala sideris TaxID=1016849 RepID=A0ABR0IVX9_9EURO|nr:hypothetical protein LTR10_018824 [Elasticomyces elasticus]KAK5021623.1 hypothetical protein LTS07_010794 [Exophiala sideris]KAK5024873.1 hypothetical protein LTR13_010716 [Exophiala sideris]KAK5049761.1 hypothetical protein LTR69_010818 [Exophiala sideris]KAK5176741.1 hypothetical protein LTR44_010684 [Eurotiomycetes sp. CCFEE 6388]